MTADDRGLHVTVDDDGIGLVMFDREDTMNALTQDMIAGLWDVFCELDERDDVRVIVVTGKGRVFSAGAALSGSGETFAEKPVVYRHRPWQLRTPVIGALNGSAVGVGLTLACQWDIRIMAEDAKYGFVFTRRGLAPEANSAWTVPRLIGMAHALDLMITGRFFSGSEAVAFGLASRAVPRDEVLSAALELAREIARSTSPAAVAATKNLLWAAIQEPSSEGGAQLDESVYAWARSSADTREGVAAFLERRPPSFTTSKTRDFPDALMAHGSARAGQDTSKER